MSSSESIKEVQISFRTAPETKRLARIEAAKNNMSLNEWIKHLVEQNITAPENIESTQKSS